MNELMVTSFNETMQLGDVLAKSGFFQDSADAAKAIVKILAGRELGFGPVASMTGINVIKGKVSLSANLIAAAIKRSGRYNYRVSKLDDTTCTIKFFEGKDEIGESTFTMNDAKAAGLATDNWRKFPRNMLFARAISNGAKWYCPDLSGGPLYTPDELGATIDGDTGEVIELPTEKPAAKPAPAPAAPQPTSRVTIDAVVTPPQPTPAPTPARPWSPEVLKERITASAAKLGNGTPADDGQRTAALIALSALTARNDTHRHAITEYLFGKPSSKMLSNGECQSIVKWAAVDSEGNPSPNSVAEAAAIIAARLRRAGELG